METSYFYKRLLILLLTYPLFTEAQLECYQCSDLDITTDISAPDYAIVKAFEDTLRDYRCYQRVPGETRDPVYENGNLVNTDLLYTQTCPSPVLGSKQTIRCGMWRGKLYTTLFGDKNVEMNAFSFGCIEARELVDKISAGSSSCFSRNNEQADKVQFEMHLKRKFQENVVVRNFVGELCIYSNANDQKTSAGNRPFVGMGIVTLALAIIMFL